MLVADTKDLSFDKDCPTSDRNDFEQSKTSNTGNLRERNQDSMKDNQELLFDLPPDWREYWKSMPEYNQEDLMPYQSMQVHFRSEADRQALAKLLDQRLTEDTKSIWFPKAEKHDFSKISYRGP